ncbi:MAG: T9SS type A sorting domain-containing protein [Candidatus Hodarchaeota archaeon]
MKIIKNLTSLLLIFLILSYLFTPKSFQLHAFWKQHNKNNINIIAPNGGDVWYINNLYQTKWSYSGDITDSLKIELTRDGGTTWETLNSGVSFAESFFSWKVTEPISYNCKIKIVNKDNNKTSDQSNERFAIIDSSNISINTLLKNSYKVFKMLRNDLGIYADALRFQPPQFHPCSVASIGMGLISLCIANELKYENNVEELVIQTLNTILGRHPGFTPARNEEGFYRHWIDPQTGEQAWNSEFSSIDTGILVSGALFCKKYFSYNQEIANLADSLFLSVMWANSIADAKTGKIYMTFDQKGKGLNTTLPFNEYMIVAWLAMNDVRKNNDATNLWNRYYVDPINLPKSTYNGIEVLTDYPGNFLSNFVIQFPYYLCNFFTKNPEYKYYFDNAILADKKYWETITQSPDYIWGTGAGASGFADFEYHADNFNDNPGIICSPHIIAGFISVNPIGIINLFSIYNDSLGIYHLLDSIKTPILWRFSLQDSSWKANDIQGVDYSTMIFGLASHPQVLGSKFFEQYNDFDFPSEESPVNYESKQQDTANIKNLMLYPNYPNPFNPQTTISFALPITAEVIINILNLNGQLISKLFKGKKKAGCHSIIWYALNIPTGIYFIKMQTDNFVMIRKCILLK